MSIIKTLITMSIIQALLGNGETNALQTLGALIIGVALLILAIMMTITVLFYAGIEGLFIFGITMGLLGYGLDKFVA